MPHTRDGQHYVVIHDEQGRPGRLFTEGLVEAQPWPEDDGEVVPTICVPHSVLLGSDDDDEPEAGAELRLTGERPTLNGARGPPWTPGKPFRVR
jgi:hypothetical protein